MEIYENRPYVICHILSALDGNISGEYFMMPELGEAQEAFARIRTEYNCDAFLAEAVTAAAIYADGFLGEEERTEREKEQQTMAANAAASGEERPEHAEASQKKSRETFVADAHAKHYAVIIDTEGNLRWTKGHIKRAGMPEMHMIEVLTENVPVAFTLLDVQKVEGGGIWLRYAPK